jgi:hypothetical protein
MDLRLHFSTLNPVSYKLSEEFLLKKYRHCPES